MREKRVQYENGECEPWLDWQKRTMRSAWAFVTSQRCDIRQTLLDAKYAWAGHVARFGMGSRPQHLLKHIILWRNLDWWNLQKQQNSSAGCTRLVHKAKVGQFMRYDFGLPAEWILTLGTGSTGSSIGLPGRRRNNTRTT